MKKPKNRNKKYVPKPRKKCCIPGWMQITFPEHTEISVLWGGAWKNSAVRLQETAGIRTYDVTLQVTTFGGKTKETDLVTSLNFDVKKHVEELWMETTEHFHAMNQGVVVNILDSNNVPVETLNTPECYWWAYRRGNEYGLCLETLKPIEDVDLVSWVFMEDGVQLSLPKKIYPKQVRECEHLPNNEFLFPMWTKEDEDVVDTSKAKMLLRMHN